MKKCCDGAKNQSGEFVDLNVSCPPEYKEVVFGMPSAFIYICVCPSLNA
jgi:hypothetical protein